MDRTKFYNRWTKDALVQRIQALESEIQQRDRQQQHGPAATVAPGVTAPAEVSEEAGDAALSHKKKKKKLKRQQDQQSSTTGTTTTTTTTTSNSSKIDPSKYSTRPVALKLAYLGRNYGGFEFQSSSHLPTIEEALWKALVKACLVFPDNPAEVRLDDWGYSKCGRTDRGVSAFGQVIAIRLRSNRPKAQEPKEEGEVPANAEEKGVKGGEEAVVAGDAQAEGREEAEDAQSAPAAGTQTVRTEEGEGEPAEGAREGTSQDTGVSGEKKKEKKKRKQNKTEKSEGAAQEAKREFDDFTDEIQYCKVLNRLLPRDIRVLAWCPATPEGFSARHDCRERQYRYFFTQPAYAPVPSSLLLLPEEPSASSHDHSNREKEKEKRGKPKDGWLDIDAMRDAARRFEGLHDFRNFCKVDPSKLIVNFERRIFECDVVKATDAETALPFLSGDDYLPQPEFLSGVAGAGAGAGAGAVGAEKRFPKVYYFHVRGSAFLWHQIRCMVAVLFMVGQGLEEPSIVDRLLDIERQPRRPNYVLANDTPLVLWDCIFPDLSLSPSPSSSPEALSNPNPVDHPPSTTTTTTTTTTKTSRPPRTAPRNVHNIDAALPWVYIGEEHPGNKHGPVHGLVDDLWATWRERKLDELLAAQLLNLAIAQSDATRRLDRRAPALLPYPGMAGGPQKRVGPGGGASQRVFEGGHLPHAVGRYQPVLAKATLPSPAEVYEREARRKGYGSAEGWREAIARKREEAMERAGGAGADAGVGEIVEEDADEVE